MGPQFFVHTNFDFVAKRPVFVALAVAYTAASLVAISTVGLNLGVEFTGGAQIEVNFDESKTAKEQINISTVRDAIDAAGIKGAQVVTIGSESEHAFLIRVQALEQASNDLGANLGETLKAKYGERLAYFDFDKESLDRATVRFEDPSITAADVKATVAAAAPTLGIGVEEVTQDKATGSMVIRLENAANDALTALTAKFGPVYDSSIDSIGAAVSKDLKRNALQAIFIACILIGIYVWLRFDWEFAPGVVLALAHDAIAVLGVWSICGKVLGFEGFEFNLTIVAAILAIIGYSVNDTVVVFDRIRETKEKYQSQTRRWIINKSINETLSRTILTSSATALSVIAIGLLGGESIRWFGWAMTIGIFFGTYSSIAIAAPVTLWVEDLRDKYMKVTPTETGVRAKG